MIEGKVYKCYTCHEYKLEFEFNNSDICKECKNNSCLDDKCVCPDGFTGVDCSLVLCDDLNKSNRQVRQEKCDCSKGWGGVNCNGMIN